MGHLYPRNISEIMVALIRGRGVVTLREVVAYLGRHHVPVEYAEGVCRERSMREMAAEMTLFWHFEAGQVFPVFATPEQRKAWRLWSNGLLADTWEPPHPDRRHFLEVFYNTPFRLRKRRRFIYHPTHIAS